MMLSLSSSFLVTFVTSCLPLVKGLPTGLSDDAREPPIVTSRGPLLAGSIYISFAVVALASAYLLASKSGPIRVWTCMMGISAFGWWAVRNDATVPPSLSLT